MADSKYAGMTLNERLSSAGLLARFDKALDARDQLTLEKLLALVDTETSLAKTLLGDSYECWFCGQGIDRTNGPALSIDLWELWSGGAEHQPSQTIFAHFLCAETRMKGASMGIERDIFFPDMAES